MYLGFEIFTSKSVLIFLLLFLRDEQFHHRGIFWFYFVVALVCSIEILDHTTNGSSTCFSSIHFWASCTLANSTKANPREAPTLKWKPTQTCVNYLKMGLCTHFGKEIKTESKRKVNCFFHMILRNDTSLILHPFLLVVLSAHCFRHLRWRKPLGLQLYGTWMDI